MAFGNPTILTALLTIVVLLRAFSNASSETLKDEIDVFNGSVHAWWILFNVPMDTVNAALPEKSPGMKVSVPAAEGVSAGNAFFLVEAGTVMNYGFTTTGHKRINFDFMRVSIPWVQVEGTLFRYKQVMYTDKLEELASSYLYYGIATTLASFTVGNSNISVTFHNMSFNATFTNETGE